MSVMHISTDMPGRVNAIKPDTLAYMPMINIPVSWQERHVNDCASDEYVNIQSISGLI